MHYAGPDLNVKNFKQGLFAAPPTGGDPKNPLATLSGYGRTTGLPYDAYTPGPADFAAFFMDPHTTAISPGTGTSVDHASFLPGRRPPVPQRAVAEDHLVRQVDLDHPATGVPGNRTPAEGISTVCDGSVPVDGCDLADAGRGRRHLHGRADTRRDRRDLTSERALAWQAVRVTTTRTVSTREPVGHPVDRKLTVVEAHADHAARRTPREDQRAGGGHARWLGDRRRLGFGHDLLAVLGEDPAFTHQPVDRRL